MPDWLQIIADLDDTRGMLGDAIRRAAALDRLDFIFPGSRSRFVGRVDAS
ncbi:hypothetical protein [Burkholderia sp. IMCC1007]|nr:hypothetical protein [Burkholderia sp. IMCC1007]